MRTILVGLLVAGGLGAETVAIVNARIIPVSAPEIEKGTIVVTGGKISAVGAKVVVPKDAKKIDGAGLSVYPGYVDGYTGIGLSEIASVRGTLDTTELGPYNPQIQSWIAVNPHSEMVKTARVNGITTAAVAPSGGRISGAAAVIDLLGKYPDQMKLASFGMVMNIPSVNRREGRGSGGAAPDAAGWPNRRQQVAEDLAKLKQYLREAKAYAEMRARQDKASVANTARDPQFEALIPVMRGELFVICNADHFRDIRAAVQLGEEFGLKIIIAGGADAAKVAALLKEKNIPVLYDGEHSLPRVREDDYDLPFATPELLRKAGVKFAIVTGARDSSDSRNLPYKAAQAAAYGLEKEDAVKAITIWPAEILGVASKVGSIEPGKLANLIIVKGDPLDIRAEVKYVLIEGKLVPFESRNIDLYDAFKQ